MKLISALAVGFMLAAMLMMLWLSTLAGRA